jgi:hypothetical protein
MSADMKAYLRYREWCMFLDIQPADYYTWQKETSKLSATNIAALDFKPRKRGIHS